MLYKIINSRTTHLVDKLRDTDTKSHSFREIVKQLGSILAYEASKNMPLSEKTIPHWQGEYNAKYIPQDNIGVFPVLRAGLGMIEGVMEHFPDSSIYHLGMYRNEEDAQPVWYKKPATVDCSVAIIPDPMLATGGSALESIKLIQEYGCSKINLLSIIAAPEGIDRLVKEVPDVDIYVAAIDSHLNDTFFIIPGLGDAGDRMFNT
ncbi:MAG: uracil phosphoribosyltransferase [Candidatus Woesearchaeota archaeon]